MHAVILSIVCLRCILFCRILQSLFIELYSPYIDNSVHTICDRHTCNDTIICLNVVDIRIIPIVDHPASGLILFQWNVKTDNLVNNPFPAGVVGYPDLNEHPSSWQTRVMGY